MVCRKLRVIRIMLDNLIMILGKLNDGGLLAFKKSKLGLPTTISNKLVKDNYTIK